VKTRIVVLRDLTDHDVSQWMNLLSRAIDPYPFMDPRMLIPSVQHRPAASAMRVLFVEDGSELLALMPFTVTPSTRLRLKRVSTRTAFFEEESGWDHPLVDVNRTIDAMEGLLLGLRSLRLPGLVEFWRLPTGPLEDALRAAASKLRVPLLERGRWEYGYARPSAGDPVRVTRSVAQADPETPSFTLRHFSGRSRRNFTKLATALALEIGAELTIETRSHDPGAITQFIELQASGWKGDPSRGGDGLAVNGFEDWFKDVTSRYRADGDLLVFALTAGAETVHLSVITRIHDSLFGWLDTYDERFAGRRAGALGRAASLNRALSEPGVRIFDPNLMPHMAEALLLFSDRQERVKILVGNRRGPSRAFVRLLLIARNHRQRIRGPQ
jgi:hypothetical protein